MNWPLHRIFLSAFANQLHPRGHAAHVRADCTSGFRCWRREALARLPLARHGFGRLRFPRRDALRGEPPRTAASARFRSSSSSVRAGHSKVSTPVLLESLVIPWRLGAPPIPVSMSEVVVMVTTSYPALPGRQRRHLHGADCRVGCGARARGPCRRALAPARRARARTKAASVFISYSYAPFRALNVFGYAAALRADVSAARRGTGARRRWRSRAGWFAAWRVARERRRDRHARPLGGSRRFTACGGGTATAAGRQPARIRRLRRRDVRPARRAARAGFRSRRRHHSLQRGSGAAVASALAPIPAKLEVVPYGVDTADSARSRSDASRCGRDWAWRSGTLLVFSARPVGQKEGIRAPDRRVGPLARVNPRRRSSPLPAMEICGTSCADRAPGWQA